MTKVFVFGIIGRFRRFPAGRASPQETLKEPAPTDFASEEIPPAASRRAIRYKGAFEVNSVFNMNKKTVKIRSFR